MEVLCSATFALHSDLCPHLDTVCIAVQRETDDSLQPQFALTLTFLTQKAKAALREHLMPSDVSALLMSPPVGPCLSRSEPQTQESDDHYPLPAPSCLHLNFDCHPCSPTLDPCTTTSLGLRA